MEQLDAQALCDAGLAEQEADDWAQRITRQLATTTAETCWRTVSKEMLRPEQPFALHETLFHSVYRERSAHAPPPPAWIPDEQTLAASNIQQCLAATGLKTFEDLHAWSIANRSEFWNWIIARLDIQFRIRPSQVLTPDSTAEQPQWLAGAQLNITESCFQAPQDETAIITRRGAGKPLERLSYHDLERLTNRVANGLRELGLASGEAVAIDLPMTAESVAIYLGIVRAGCVAVSIADSFAAKEIEIRLRIADAKAIFTQDEIVRGSKRLPLYQKVAAAQAPLAIVLPAGRNLSLPLREGDIAWETFLSNDEAFLAVIDGPEAFTNILFSSGTTGDPKAIPWTQLTPLKCAMDGFFHHDIHPTDVVAWPTNLGWMMGPWLIYASLLNRATIALYCDAPATRPFGEFVQDAQVTMLGLVPSLVKAWRASDCMRGLDWNRIRAISSTGECSNADDYLFLMSLAGYKPVIEYCGGTEIGGGYLSGTVVQPASPATFSTPCLGLDLCILNEHGKPSTTGEAYLIPPSIGLSSTLLNRDHHETYFADTPPGSNGEILRRHGDQVESLPGGYIRALGRADDTMNLGGIKTSSAEIERVVAALDGVNDVAAIAVPPKGGGPSELVLYVTSAKPSPEKETLQSLAQAAIKNELNPLFLVSDLVIVESLPRTASNKVMRRVLRKQYQP
ncbi:AMP-binding protein [Pirellulales bacterium]|nr:AMP-binding protein [Pirellulales bacterium]